MTTTDPALPTSEDGGGVMGTDRSYHDVYESGQPIPADEIAEWKVDAEEYIPRLFQADPVQFAPMARFLKAALLIVEQLQSDVSQARADGERNERKWITEAVAAIDPDEQGIPRFEEDDVPTGWREALHRVRRILDGRS